MRKFQGAKERRMLVPCCRVLRLLRAKGIRINYGSVPYYRRLRIISSPIRIPNCMDKYYDFKKLLKEVKEIKRLTTPKCRLKDLPKK